MSNAGRPPSGNPSKRTKPKILVLDDSEICLEMVRIPLEENGYEVVTLTSPFGFASALTRERPDLVLMDVAMPGLQGDKLVEIVNKNQLGGKCTILLHSDRNEVELKKLVQSSGAAGYVRKTDDADGLLETVKHHLALAR